jgi:hypothetical protein
MGHTKVLSLRPNLISHDDSEGLHAPQFLHLLRCLQPLANEAEVFRDTPKRLGLVNVGVVIVPCHQVLRGSKVLGDRFFGQNVLLSSQGFLDICRLRDDGEAIKSQRFL